MSPSQIALLLLSTEVDQLIVQKPQPGTALWFTLQTKSLALSFLKAAEQKGMTADVVLFDTYRDNCRKAIGLVDG